MQLQERVQFASAKHRSFSPRVSSCSNTGSASLARENSLGPIELSNMTKVCLIQVRFLAVVTLYLFRLSSRPLVVILFNLTLQSTTSPYPQKNARMVIISLLHHNM